MKRVQMHQGSRQPLQRCCSACRSSAEEGPLPKQGQFSGKFGWWAVGKVYQLGKDQIYWNGEFNGTFFNDAGGGFLHGSSWVCPGYNELRGGVSLASGGRCVVTDMDGDKMFVDLGGGPGERADEVQRYRAVCRRHWQVRRDPGTTDLPRQPGADD